VKFPAGTDPPIGQGDAVGAVTLFRLAEQTGQFDDVANPILEIRRVIVSWKDHQKSDNTVVIDPDVPDADDFPAKSEISKEDVE
jgi:hypothetical protein